MKKHALSAAFAALALAAPLHAALSTPAAAQSNQSAVNLTGAWRGVYAGDGNANTEFTATMSSLGSRLSGAMVEPNTFGSGDVAFLLSTITGQIDGSSVVFLKTYDGSGGQSHTVRYEGRISANGRRIAGTWTTGGVSGPFEMVR
ncbi:MAG: hypothetical protein NW203_08350 [Hyphomonadaceae bacterium]|nr:hypothetical protein [Hyphomonadaceae bacterium]